MSTIDQQFVEFMVKSLVSNPDAVHIDRRIDDKGVLLELTVDPEDLGRIIGKRGATAQSLRTLLRALGTKNEERYNLKIIDNGPQDNYQRPDTSTQSPRDTTSTQNQPINEEPTQDAPVAPAAVVDDDSEEPETVVEEETSDRVSKTRRELEDLDDLDI